MDPTKKEEETKQDHHEADAYDRGEEVIVWIPVEFQLKEESEELPHNPISIEEELEEHDEHELERAILLRANGDENVLQVIYKGLPGLNAEEAMEFVKLGEFKVEKPKGPFTIIRDRPVAPKQTGANKKFVYYPLTRFAPIVPSDDKKKYTIYISPAYDRRPFGPVLTADELALCAENIKSYKDRLAVVPIEAQDAIKKGLSRIGENFLG